MTGILFIIFLIFWFSLIRWVINLWFRSAFDKENSKGGRKVKIVRRTVIFLLFMVPFSKATVVHLYQTITFPLVCTQMAGYKINKNVNEGASFEYLPIRGVDFVEWENKSYMSPLAKEFGSGKFRYTLYPKGSSECVRLNYIYEGAEDALNNITQRYISYGYPVKNINGKCVGVEKVINLKSKYSIRSGDQKNIDSGFGYSVDRKYTQLIDNSSNQAIKSYDEIGTSSPTPFINWVSPFATSHKSCSSHNELIDEHKKNFGDVWRINKKLVIERRLL